LLLNSVYSMIMLSNLFQIHLFANAKTNKLYWSIHRCFVRMITSKQYRKCYSSAEASSSSASSNSFFLLGFSYSSGTFSRQPLPETFKKAALLPFCYLLLSACITIFCFAVLWSFDVPHVVAFVSCILSIFLSFSHFFVSFNLTLGSFTVSSCHSCCTLRYHNKKQWCDPFWFVKN